MKKIFLGLFILMFLAVAAFSAQAAITVSVSQPTYPGTQTAANPGDTVTFTYSIVNTEARTFTVTGSSTAPTLGQNTITAPSITPVSVPINAGQGAIPAATGSFSIVVPSKTAGTYTATLNIQEQTNVTNSASANYNFVLNPVEKLNIQEATLELSATRGKSKTGQVTVENTGSISLSTFTATHTVKLNDTDGSVITFTLTPPTTLAPGATASLSNAITNVPEDMAIGKYTGQVTLKSGTVSDVYDITLNVQPELCELGVQGSLRVNIEDPDNGDNFKPGETFDVKVAVKNNNNQDKDVIVEAFLWNLDENQEIESVESDSIDVEDSKEEDFVVSFTMPTDEDDLGASDDFVIFVKAYEDGEEDSQCGEDSIEIQGERESRDVQISRFTATPTVLQCNALTNFQVDVENRGTREDKLVDIRVINSQLGIDLVSEKFTLEKFDDSDNVVSKTFSFRVPEDAEVQEYSLEAIATFDSGKKKDSEFLTVNVNKCGETTTTSGADFSLPQPTLTARPGTLAVPFTLTNKGDTLQAYVVEIEPIGTWTTKTSTTVLVQAKETKVQELSVLTAQNLVAGTYQATINMLQDGTVVARQPLQVTINAEGTTTPTGGTVFQPTTTAGSFYRNWVDSGRIFWILGIIVLIVLIIFFLSLIFRRRQ